MVKKFVPTISPMLVTAYSLFCSGIILLPLLIFYMLGVTQISAINWFYSIMLGIFSTAIAYIILYKLVSTIGAYKATSAIFMVPIFTFIWGYLLLGEVVTLNMLVATVIILSGTALVIKLIKIK